MDQLLANMIAKASTELLKSKKNKTWTHLIKLRCYIKLSHIKCGKELLNYNLLDSMANDNFMFTIYKMMLYVSYKVYLQYINSHRVIPKSW